MRIERRIHKRSNKIKGSWRHYTSERIVIPVPSKLKDTVRPWLGKDLRIQIEPFKKGFGVLVYSRNNQIETSVSQGLRRLLRQLETEMLTNTFE